VSPATRLLRYSTTVPSTTVLSTTVLLDYCATRLLCYSTTPLLYYFTTAPPLCRRIPCSHCVTRSPGCSRDRPALLYYFTIPLLHCFTTSLPHHHYVNINIHCTHTASLALQGAVEIDQCYSTTSLLYYFTTSPPLCIHVLCSHYSTTSLLHYLTTTSLQHIHVLNSHCVARSPGCSRDRPALLYYSTTLLLHYLTTTM
jgi:hypothetical protein